APVGNTERLVEVQVGDIAAEGARLGDAHQGVEVGAVDVHLAAVPVHQGADGGDVLLEHPVGGGVGDHQRGEPVAVLLGLDLQVGEVHVAPLVAFHHHHIHAHHLRRGGVGAVGGGGDQADVAVVIAAAPVVLLDGHEARVLPLGAGVGLQGDGVVA